MSQVYSERVLTSRVPLLLRGGGPAGIELYIVGISARGQKRRWRKARFWRKAAAHRNVEVTTARRFTALALTSVLYIRRYQSSRNAAEARKRDVSRTDPVALLCGIGERLIRKGSRMWGREKVRQMDDAAKDHSTSPSASIPPRSPEIAKFPVKFPVSREFSWRRVRSALRRQPASHSTEDSFVINLRYAHQWRVFADPGLVSSLKICTISGRNRR